MFKKKRNPITDPTSTELANAYKTVYNHILSCSGSCPHLIGKLTKEESQNKIIQSYNTGIRTVMDWILLWSGDRKERDNFLSEFDKNSHKYD